MKLFIILIILLFSFRVLAIDTKAEQAIVLDYNTKEILSKNKNLDNISTLKNKILNQLNSLSNKNSNSSGLLSLTSFGKNQIAYTYIRETNTLDSISKIDIERGNYQKNKIFIDTTLLKDVYKTILGNYIISSNQDIILENIIRDHDKTKQKIDSDFLSRVSRTS